MLIVLSSKTPEGAVVVAEAMQDPKRKGMKEVAVLSGIFGPITWLVTGERNTTD